MSQLPRRSFEIKPLGPEDGEALGDLFAQLAMDPKAVHFHPHPFTRTEAKRIAKRIGIREDQYFAAFVDGRLAGYGMLRGWDEGYAIPSFGVAVGAAFRGAGIGKSMMRYAMQTARRRGATSMILKVYSSNHVARHIYESVGFTFDPVPLDDGQIRGTLLL